MGFLGTLANSIPVVGHVKGIVHYMCGDKEGGNTAMLTATRNTTVCVVGAFFGATTGPVGGMTAASVAGAYCDAATALATDGKYANGFGKVIADPGDPASWCDAVIQTATDGAFGYSSASIGQNTLKLDSNLAIKKVLSPSSDKATKALAGKLIATRALGQHLVRTTEILSTTLIPGGLLFKAFWIRNRFRHAIGYGRNNSSTAPTSGNWSGSQQAQIKDADQGGYAGNGGNARNARNARNGGNAQNAQNGGNARNAGDPDNPDDRQDGGERRGGQRATIEQLRRLIRIVESIALLIFALLKHIYGNRVQQEQVQQEQVQQELVEQELVEQELVEQELVQQEQVQQVRRYTRENIRFSEQIIRYFQQFISAAIPLMNDPTVRLTIREGTLEIRMGNGNLVGISRQQAALLSTGIHGAIECVRDIQQRCNRESCRICPRLREFQTERGWTGNCETRNVIYCFYCQTCKRLVYAGQTVQLVRDRMTGHLNDSSSGVRRHVDNTLGHRNADNPRQRNSDIVLNNFNIIIMWTSSAIDDAGLNREDKRRVIRNWEVLMQWLTEAHRSLGGESIL